MPEITDKIAFHYLKSTLFRVIHTDGVVGGVTPSGDLHIALFSQRAAIPQRVVMRTTSGGGLGEEIEEDGFSRGGIVRELEVDAVLSLSTAKIVRDFLSKQIAQLEAMLEQPKPRQAPPE